MKETDKQTIEFTNPQLRRLIGPLVVEQFLAIMVGLLDSVMVSQVGEAAVSAVSLVDSVNVMLVFAFGALATGGAVIVGQYLGRSEGKKAGHAGSQLMLFMLEVSLAITLVLYLGRTFLLGTVFGKVEPDVAAYANTYYLITAASTVFLAVYSAGAALFRVMGNSRISMWVSLLMNLINVGGNALLIFGFRMGVEGVAIPTLVSRIVAAAAMVLLLNRPGLVLRLERLTLKHDPFVVRYILRYGVVNGMESVFFQLGKIVLLSTVSALGTAAVAANAIGNNVACIQNIPGQAMGMAMVTVVSQCVGAGDFAKARYYAKKLMRWIYVTFGSVAVLVLICLPWILGLYNVSPEAEEAAFRIVWLCGVAGIFLWPMSFSLPEALIAAGDTRYTMVTGTISMWTARVGLGLLLARGCGLGLMGVWYAMVVDWLVRGIAYIIRFRGHRWEEKFIREQ